MSLPDAVPLDVDEWHEQLHDELDDEGREQVLAFVENGLTDRVNQLVEEAIYKRYQQSKHD